MTTAEAINLIEAGQPSSTEPLTWADLGCGSGVFSRALASLLPVNSKITCIDQQQQDFKECVVNGVTLEFIRADFTQLDFGSLRYDGFLLANSLHFIQKKTFFQYLRGQLKAGGTLLLVEYDSSRSNPWVPYPIPFAELVRLGQSVGFRQARKLGEHRSVYGPVNMYACELKLSAL